jgi:tRNA threonylcarbamoyl adenosine modification protein (Sua5/YciO/YrdC/YwlC family)
VSDAEAFELCLADGGVAVFPSDTVYGLACDPENRAAVERLYALKGRSLEKPSAVMFFGLEAALAALPELGERVREAMRRLLPSPLGLLVPNPRHRFALACGADPQSLGIRVPRLEWMTEGSRPALQSSANLAGGADPRRLEEVPQAIRDAADLVIDGGVLPGTPSTLVDLRHHDRDGSWSVVRPGAVGEEVLQRVLGDQFHFHPESYLAEIRADMRSYDRLQDELVSATGAPVRRILELGTGTGETARRLLARHPEAHLTGLDESPAMLAAARDSLAGERAELLVARLQDPLPGGPFDLVASALSVHHLDAEAKADLFRRVRSALSPGGRFVLADVVLPPDPRDALTPLTPGFDQPSAVSDQLEWLERAGFEARVAWESGDLAVIVGLASPAPAA